MSKQQDDNQRFSRRLSELAARGVKSAQHIEEHAQQHISAEATQLNKVRRITNRHRLLSILIPFSIVLIFAIYIVSPLSQAKTVQVVGNDELTKEAVMKATGVRPGRYMYGLIDQQQKVENEAKKANHQLASVKIRLVGWRKLRVTVTENKILGLVTINGKQRYLLTNGSWAPVSGTVPNDVTYENFTGHVTALQQTARQLGRLPNPIRHSISAVRYSPTKVNPQRIKLYMNDGNTVLVKRSSLAKKMNYYPSIASQMSGNGVVDLQVGAYSYGYGDKAK